MRDEVTVSYYSRRIGQDNIACDTHLEFRRILELGYEMGKLVMVGSILLSVAETEGEGGRGSQ